MLKCEQGNTWAARKISLPELENGIKVLLKEIKWVGPVELEFIRDSFDEEFKLIEINCRFPAWISYAKDVGYNLPLMAVDLALEQKTDNFFKNDDLIFIRNCNEFSADRVQFGKFLKTEIIDNEKK